MPSARLTSASALWWTATVVVAGCLFAVALSDSVYEATSPPGAFQILLRKTYSVGAFTLVGFLLSKALQTSSLAQPLMFPAVAIAAYSFLIEVGQFAEGVREGLLWNGVDVACGFVGGYLGWLLTRPGARPHR